MIGCVEEAAELVEFGIEHDEHWDVIAPEGWEFLGDGAYRYAFRSPSGVVYKIENEDGEYEGHNNREFENIQRCKLIPVQGWRVPEATVYHVNGHDVIAMEYIAGGESDILCQKSFEYRTYNRLSGRKYKCTCGKPKGRCIAEVWHDISEAWDIEDIHTGNIRIEENGTRVLIDVADSRSS
jgi:hypothetical protein